jgi:sec-independent protein translocase protein TatB
VFDITGWEFVILIVLAVVVLGPDRLPEYAAKLARVVRQVRAMAEGAKGQLKEQLGPDFEDINWRQYDPRLYDPRRIVREALMEPLPPAEPTAAEEDGGSAPGVRDPTRPTPYDVDAT